MIKKGIGISLLFCLLGGLFPAETSAKSGCKKQSFLVSAYYSPLPGQKKYIRGTYKGDIRLNGNGTNGADGTQVYMGLLAAPRGYKFGTKINLPGVGLGTVHDRGGAIIAKANYDRIDIWMGRGEPGLSRALNWGMRFIDGEICTSGADTLNYNSVSSKLPKYVEKRLISRTTSLKNGGYYTFKTSGVGGKIVTVGGKYGNKTPKYVAPKIIKKEEKFEFVKIPKDIGEGDIGENVLKLQMILKNIGFYRDETLTGKYDIATMEAVFSFQRENLVVDSSDELGAGHFGKKTKRALDNYLKKLHSETKIISQIKKGEIKKGDEIVEKIKEDIKIEDIIGFDKLEKKQQIITLSNALTVKEIQKILKTGKKISPKDNGLILSLIPGKIVNKSKIFMP